MTVLIKKEKKKPLQAELTILNSSAFRFELSAAVILFEGIALFTEPVTKCRAEEL